MCDATIEFFLDFNLFALTAREYMAAWKVIDGFSRVSAWIISIPTYTILEPNRRLFWLVHNFAIDVFGLFQNFSTVQDTMVLPIVQQSERVFEIGRCAARILSSKKKPREANVRRWPQAGKSKIRDCSRRSCRGFGLGFVRGHVVFAKQLREIFLTELSVRCTVTV